MTVAKPHHLAARRLLLQHLDLHPGKTVRSDLDPLEAGIVGDTDHEEGGDSYHLGKDKIRAKAGRSRYSVDESARDLRGLDNYASGMDIGYFKVVTVRGSFTLYDLNAWLIGLCRAGDPDTADLREVIYSLDGVTVKRWDRLNRRATGDSSHRDHTHLSEHRDANGHRMVNLARRWLQRIGLIPEENEVTPDDRKWITTEFTRLIDARAKTIEATLLAKLPAEVAKDVLDEHRFAWSADKPGQYTRNLADLVGDPWAIALKGTTRGGDPLPASGAFGQILAAVTALRAEVAELKSQLPAA
jgi:hypothetical protein